MTRVLLSYRRDIRSCVTSNRVGTITANFTIEASGKLSDIYFENPDGFSRVVLSCVREKGIAFKFPPPRGGKSIQVHFPFRIKKQVTAKEQWMRAAKNTNAKALSAGNDDAKVVDNIAPDEAALDDSIRSSKKSKKGILRGSLIKSEIQSVIRARMLEIKHCYEQYLKDGGERMGKVNTKFTIGKEGNVIKNEVTSAVDFGPTMLGCIEHTIDTLVFPKPKGGGKVFVNYPFVFSASESPPRKRFNSCLWSRPDPPAKTSNASFGGRRMRALNLRPTNLAQGGIMHF